MNAKNFDSLVRANRDYHNAQIKAAHIARLLRSRNSVPATSLVKWTLVAILFVTVLAAGIG